MMEYLMSDSEGTSYLRMMPAIILQIAYAHNDQIISVLPFVQIVPLSIRPESVRLERKENSQH